MSCHKVLVQCELLLLLFSFVCLHCHSHMRQCFCALVRGQSCFKAIDGESERSLEALAKVGPRGGPLGSEACKSVDEGRVSHAGVVPARPSSQRVAQHPCGLLVFGRQAVDELLQGSELSAVNEVEFLREWMNKRSGVRTKFLCSSIQYFVYEVEVTQWLHRYFNKHWQELSNAFLGRHLFHKLSLKG